MIFFPRLCYIFWDENGKTEQVLLLSKPSKTLRGVEVSLNWRPNNSCWDVLRALQILQGTIQFPTLSICWLLHYKMHILFLAVPKAASLELLCSGINFPLWWLHNAGLNAALVLATVRIFHNDLGITSKIWTFEQIFSLANWISVCCRDLEKTGQFDLGSPCLSTVAEIKNGDYCHP